MKTNELTGRALDWAAAKCEGRDLLNIYGGLQMVFCPYYSTEWFDGGPIIEREKIAIVPLAWKWEAQYEAPDLNGHVFHGNTPLIAAMRCYVTSKLGDEIEIPQELTT